MTVSIPVLDSACVTRASLVDPKPIMAMVPFFEQFSRHALCPLQEDFHLVSENSNTVMRKASVWSSVLSEYTLLPL